jgi:hypothetical protein
MPPIWPCREVLELPAPRPKVCEMEEVSAGLVPELGIPYENGGPIALGVYGGVATAIDGVGPLCNVVAAETMVVWAVDKGKLGEASPVVTTVIGMEEIP